MNLINFFILQWLFVRLEKCEEIQKDIKEQEFFIGEHGEISVILPTDVSVGISQWYELCFFAIPLTGWVTGLLFFGEPDYMVVSKIKTIPLDVVRKG